MLAFTCHGSVITMHASEQDPLFTDPDATVAWTHDPQFKVSLSCTNFFFGTSVFIFATLVVAITLAILTLSQTRSNLNETQLSPMRFRS